MTTSLGRKKAARASLADGVPLELLTATMIRADAYATVCAAEESLAMKCRIDTSIQALKRGLDRHRVGSQMCGCGVCLAMLAALHALKVDL